MLSGCFPAGTSVPTSDTSTGEIWAEAEKIENFSLTLTLPREYPEELPEITAAVMRWDEKTVLDNLQDGREILSTEESPSYGFPDEKMKVYVFFEDDGGGDYVGFEPGRVSDRRLTSRGNMHNSIMSYLTKAETDKLTTVDELDGFTKADAVNSVKDLARGLGITHLGEPDVFALTAEEVNRYLYEESRLAESETGAAPPYTEWTKNDEAYFITFPLVYDGIQVAACDVAVTGVTDNFTNGSKIDAIVTRDGILDFKCDGITSPDYEMGKATAINFGAADILSKIVSDYSNRSLMNEYEFYDCELVYGPIRKLDDGRWVYAPMWRFDYTEKTPYEPEKIRHQLIYNAETGNEIALEWNN